MIILNDVKRIIFDLDNVVIKHNQIVEAEETGDAIGIIENERFKAQLAFMYSSINEYIKDTIVTEDILAETIEFLMPILKENGKTGKQLIAAINSGDTSCLMEDADEILQYLYSKGYQIVALTNWFYRYQVHVLERLNIFDYFDRVYAWDGYYAKPNRLAVIRALGNTNPLNNVLIGDDPISDIVPANKCGIHTIGFNIDYNRLKKVTEERVADINITKLSEIKKYL